MKNKFDYAILDAISNAVRTVKAAPLVLGGVAGSGGGAGGPPGGFVGYLPQTRVSYDYSEEASSGIAESGSLLDNLNHIRYRLGVIESGGFAGSITIEDEGIIVASGVTVLNFIGDSVVASEDSPGIVNVTISGAGSGSLVASFLDLTDTPSSYSGQAGKSIIVNPDETGLTFATISGSSSFVIFNVDGHLATLSGASMSFLVTDDITITGWYIYCEYPGSGGSTIADINVDGVTLFTEQENRPELLYNDSDGWNTSGDPSVSGFVLGNILTIDIDQVASGAYGLTIVGEIGGTSVAASSGGGSFVLTLEESDGSPSINGVTRIIIPSGYLTDNGGGEAEISYPQASSEDYILLQDQKAQNTSGGTFTSGADRVRDIAEIIDTGNHCSVTANQITLAAGTYEVEITCPAFKVNRHQAWLYNVTDSTIVTSCIGSSEFSNNAQTSSTINGRFTIASAKVFEIRHRCKTSVATQGFGVEANFNIEVYTQAVLRKVS